MNDAQDRPAGEVPDFPPPPPPKAFQDAIDAIDAEIREKRTYVRVDPKTDDPDDLLNAIKLENLMNDAIAENPSLLAEWDRSMTDVRERWKRLLLYGDDA